MNALNGFFNATSFDDFRNALKSWVAPSQNFIYADPKGNIGKKKNIPTTVLPIGFHQLYFFPVLISIYLHPNP